MNIWNCNFFNFWSLSSKIFFSFLSYIEYAEEPFRYQRSLLDQRRIARQEQKEREEEEDNRKASHADSLDQTKIQLEQEKQVLLLFDFDINHFHEKKKNYFEVFWWHTLAIQLKEGVVLQLLLKISQRFQKNYRTTSCFNDFVLNSSDTTTLLLLF